MPPLTLSTNDQKLADAAQAQQLQMWMAAQTVRARVAEEDGREELLECLGLVDVVQPG